MVVKLVKVTTGVRCGECGVWETQQRKKRSGCEDQSKEQGKERARRHAFIGGIY
jgi:hypothetical protein